MDGNPVASDHAEARPDMRWKSVGGTVTDDGDGLSRKLESMWLRQTPDTDSFLGLAKPTREGAVDSKGEQADIKRNRWSIFNWFGAPVTNGTAGASNAGARVPPTAAEAPPHPTPVANNLNRRCGILDWVRGACLLTGFILWKLKILKLLEFLAFAVIVEEMLGQNGSLRVVGILLRRLGTTLEGSRD